MRGALLGVGLSGVFLLPSASAQAGGGLDVHPGVAYRGELVGVSTGGCRTADRKALVTSGAFVSAATAVHGGRTNVSVRIRPYAEYRTYPVTLTCLPSQRTVHGAVRVRMGSWEPCRRDGKDWWPAGCFHRGPETGFGGARDDGPTPLALAGLGLVAAAGLLLLVPRLRRARG